MHIITEHPEETSEEVLLSEDIPTWKTDDKVTAANPADTNLNIHQKQQLHTLQDHYPGPVQEPIWKDNLNLHRYRHGRHGAGTSTVPPDDESSTRDNPSRSERTAGSEPHQTVSQCLGITDSASAKERQVNEALR